MLIGKRPDPTMLFTLDCRWPLLLRPVGCVAVFVKGERRAVMMTKKIDVYDSHYGHLATSVQTEVRRETYGDDLGQASWITLQEALDWFERLGLGPGRKALEVACGSGGVTLQMAKETGAACVGVDINVHGIDAANQLAAREGMSDRLSFQVADAGLRLPFQDGSFDAVFCNDAINHFPGRPAVLQDWHRVLKPAGRVLFTDPIVMTGQLSSDEIRVRSSIGFFLFTPPGHNELLLERCGFAIREVRDVSEPVASVSRKWREARARRREQLIALEGEDAFEDFQRFLETVCTLSSERRLSRFMYLAVKP
jgi:SAM-dependent methyltransferase